MTSKHFSKFCLAMCVAGKYTVSFIAFCVDSALPKKPYSIITNPGVSFFSAKVNFCLFFLCVSFWTIRAFFCALRFVPGLLFSTQNCHVHAYPKLCVCAFFSAKLKLYFIFLFVLRVVLDDPCIFCARRFVPGLLFSTQNCHVRAYPILCVCAFSVCF